MRDKVKEAVAPVVAGVLLVLYVGAVVAGQSVNDQLTHTIVGAALILLFGDAVRRWRSRRLRR